MAQIKKDTSLRKAILQAAITGQLISSVVEPVETTNETGKQLLDRIIEERNNKLLAEWEDALKKNPKTKKTAPVVASEIDEDEIPFEIPENWCWCKLEDICEFENGDRSSKYPVESDYVSDGIPFFGAKDIEQKKLSFSNVRFISKEKFDSLGNGKLQNLDFICLLRGSVGKTAQFIESEKYQTGFICAQMLIIRSLFNPSFVSFLLETPYILEEIESKITGTAVRQLPAAEVKQLLIPLPPLAVQNAIVAKLEQVLPLVDAYENAVLQKEELKSTLSDKVKKAILQEAITGKLTESWRKSATITETGKQLLDRIISERNAKALADWEEKVKENPKAKKPVPVVASEIEEEEIPFEVPEGWCWCRWGELSELIQYGYNAPAIETGRIKMVRITDIQNGKVQWDTVPFCEISEADIKSYHLRKNDILFARTGGTVGKSFLVDEEPENAVFAGYLIRTQYDDKKLNPKYMKMFMESQIYWDQLKNGTIATAQPNCNGQTLSKMILPLPPLEEQEEIVKKVEELLPLCK